ncbi:J domain-containing protein [Spiroplasma turonicum]|uniref:J domain-containing protein n=1 Tax=Spiroplasma turonicum TaxID=216946 RepID=A0A0K1P734_9MOLU|nr:J domain-containing protein [Spiroplasma turonicum]AKU79702.1 hypothetical protein STURON_00456 [Spiroplasma turonicum]ALX70720.1 hypothetical protein STURO_v1c04540 [Spiroplasma turonicum]
MHSKNKVKNKLNKIYTVDDVEDINQDDDLAIFSNYDDENDFKKINFYKTIFYKDKFSEKNFNNKYLLELSFNYYNLANNLKVNELFFDSIDLKSFKIKIFDSYYNIKKFPCLIKYSNFDILIEYLDINNPLILAIIRTCYYKLTYHFHKIVNESINLNIIYFDNYIKNKIFIKDIIKLLEDHIKIILIDVINYILQNNNSIDYYAVNLILNNLILNKSYNRFIKWYKNYLNNFVNNLTNNHIDNEIKNAFDFFNLSSESSYLDFKAKYRELSKKYHPDNSHNNDEGLILKVNYYKLILENFYNM